MSASDPPRLARRFLDLVVSGPEREYVLGDLAEGYRRRARSTNVAAARRWYRGQALRALPNAFTRLTTAVIHSVSAGGPLRGGWYDVRLALRFLARRPLYAIASIGTLGLGFGAAAAVLTVANGVWFRPLPFPDADRIVRVFEVDRNARPSSSEGTEGEARRSDVSPPLIADLQSRDWRTFTGFSVFSRDVYEWHDGTEMRQLSGVTASPNVIDLLGVRPIAGRVFSGVPGVPEVLLAEVFWRSAFGADQGVVGQQLILGGVQHEIVGVLPASLTRPSVTHPRPADVWVSFDLSRADLSEGMRGARYLDVVARIAPGVTLETAAHELDGFVAGLGDTHPNHRGWGATVVEARLELVRPYRRILILLLSGAGLLLLIATLNVASLAAARRADDAHDLAVRAALGASRWRLLRQNLVESLLVSVAAAALAAVSAIWVLAPLKRLAPTDVPRLANATVDGTILIILAGAAMVVAAAIAVTGQLMANPHRIGSIGRGRSTAPSRSRGRYALTVVQVSLTTVLLLGAVLIVRQVHDLATVDPGFVADGVLLAPIFASDERYPEPATRLMFYQDVVQRLERHGRPVAIGMNVPISGVSMRYGYHIPGQEEQFWAQYHSTSSNYFDVMSIPVLSGRSFSAQDIGDGTPVVIVNEALARRHFDGQAVGREISVVGTTRTIIGVVGSTRHFGPDQDPPAELYVPLAQFPPSFAHVLVAADQLPAGALRDVMKDIDPNVSVHALAPFTDAVAEWFAPLRFQLVIIALFSALGTVLAGVGVYALIAYVVASRTREIGIRVALGAAQQSVFARVVGSGMLLVGSGVIIGALAALALQRVIRGLLAGVDPTDPVAYIAVAVGLMMVATLACAVPARRAAAVDPVVALRTD
jgi:predicted permease